MRTKPRRTVLHSTYSYISNMLINDSKLILNIKAVCVIVFEEIYNLVNKIYKRKPYKKFIQN